MRKTKRHISSFNLAFLDIMFCGFGAVVLLVLIINSHIVTDSQIKNEQLSSLVEQLKKKKSHADNKNTSLQAALQKSQNDAQVIHQQLTKLNILFETIEKKKGNNQAQSQALKTHINRLQKDLKTLDKKRSTQSQAIAEKSGTKVRRYEGEGHRQYLTGLKLGGQRVLILLDQSASMLDETIVNIIVKRNLSNASKKSTRKWQQAVNSVRWIVANLPPSSQFLIVSFNKKTQSLLDNNHYQWVKSRDKAQVNRLFKQLNQLIPEYGTNLGYAFSSIKKLPQKPDNIILITDGLPTLSNNKGNKSKVSSAERGQLFAKAVKLLPKRIPVNTILLPLEGDPMATVLFWKLAIDTKGSFMTPSRDWP